MPVSSRVKSMFADIARRYDLTNDLLSLGIHRYWRSKAMQAAAPKPGSRVIDLCCGTGDFAICAADFIGNQGQVVGVDFVLEMLELARKKSCRTSSTQYCTEFVCGDAMRAPISDGWADLVTIAFGIRNLENPLRGLKEVKRLLAPGGTALVVEFGQPKLVGFSQLFSLYSRYAIPLIGTLAAKNRFAYEYLPKTSKEFPAGEQFLSLMKEAGFIECSATAFLSGVAYLYLGRNTRVEP